MFVAKFSQASDNGVFSEDKNGNLPFIGSVLAGVAKESIINGTIFQRESYKEGQLYLCENVTQEFTDPSTGEIRTGLSTQIISEVSVLDFMALRKELGAGKLKRVTQEEYQEETQKDPNLV